MYDAIVVGARCAGAPTAMLLARKGHKVLLLDKATVPSDTMSTHFIQAPGVARLARWGLLDRLRAANTPPITKVTLNMGGISFNPPPPPGEAAPPESFCPRRTVLDKILVDAAVEAGAELREGFAVREVLKDGDCVTGVRGDAAGASQTEQATIVVGAELLFLEGVGVLAFPTNDGFTCIAVGGGVDNFHEFRKDIEGSYHHVLAGVGSLAERMRGARRETRVEGTADQPNFFRKPYGPGWALVGDAGYHRDFITGLGITDAFRDAECLANAIDAGLAGREPIEEALAAYERERNEIATPLYEFTTNLAQLTEPPSAELFANFGAAMART